eukprot:scaffold95494_cov35-Attheya_sp.AAC.2
MTFDSLVVGNSNKSSSDEINTWNTNPTQIMAKWDCEGSDKSGSKQMARLPIGTGVPTVPSLWDIV